MLDALNSKTKIATPLSRLSAGGDDVSSTCCTRIDALSMFADQHLVTSHSRNSRTTQRGDWS